MSAIIIPGDTREQFAYGKLIGGESKIPTAMVKFPISIVENMGGIPDPESGDTLFWFLRERTDDADGIEVSRYEFHTVSGSKEELPEEATEITGEKDGYVYLPKKLRDGRHEKFYFVVPIKESEFTPKVERGMFEEVAWSPFGSIAEAVKQEALNTERNPLLRRWETV